MQFVKIELKVFNLRSWWWPFRFVIFVSETNYQVNVRPFKMESENETARKRDRVRRAEASLEHWFMDVLSVLDYLNSHKQRQNWRTLALVCVYAAFGRCTQRSLGPMKLSLNLSILYPFFLLKLSLTTHALTHTHTHSLTHSHTHSLTQFTYSLTHSQGSLVTKRFLENLNDD